MKGKETPMNWVIKIEGERLQMCPSQEAEIWKRRSIYRVPEHAKALNKKAYEPLTVAFGPYHHNDKHLMPMEEHKKRALLHFLKRTNKHLQEFVKPLEEVVLELMDSYDKLDEECRDRERFLQMMVLDGCFLLEILHTTKEIPEDYAKNDPIFSKQGMYCIMPYIRRDMLMIENQIPLLVLEKLEAVVKGTTDVPIVKGTTKDDKQSLNSLILKFCTANWEATKEMGTPGLHVLDVYRKSMLGPCKIGPNQSQKTPSKIMRSAMELREGGIHFRKSNTNSLKDIDFENCGTLKLPAITIDDATEHTFLNLMAFERLHNGVDQPAVTSYVFFMDNIIDTAKDVHLLRSKGIINNALGSDDAVAKLFNSITNDITLDPECRLRVLHQNVNLYCTKRRNRWMANLRHYYVHNPWAIISIIAAIFLLVIAALQNVYTVLPYYRNNS
ncbi:UPF0481 protein At3g47200-like [Magnolia sinica]|uniref:UPF0481 protein At3g47200-like n=1 Tax=Magnolia sinica TaxID=86752 RepID=UPI0026592D0D|nr:UPF0481 protein At3g47200-like [Magnolia sinica]